MQGRNSGLILGVDPGLAGTGFALFAEPNLVLSCSTVVTIPGRDGARLLTITNHLRQLLADNPPAEASIEELFMGRNATSAVGVAQARGAILNVLEECGVPVFEYKPSQVKVILTGYGNADKSHGPPIPERGDRDAGGHPAVQRAGPDRGGSSRPVPRRPRPSPFRPRNPCHARADHVSRDRPWVDVATRQ